MIPIVGLFETHLTVVDLPRSIDFYGRQLGLTLAGHFRDPDGNLLEYVAMLDAAARPGLGIVSWSDWCGAARQSEQSIDADKRLGDEC